MFLYFFVSFELFFIVFFKFFIMKTEGLGLVFKIPEAYFLFWNKNGIKKNTRISR